MDCTWPAFGVQPTACLVGWMGVSARPRRCKKVRRARLRGNGRFELRRAAWLVACNHEAAPTHARTASARTTSRRWGHRSLPQALLPSSFLPTERQARVWSASPASSALSVARHEGRLPPSLGVSAGSLSRHQLISLYRGCSSPSVATSSSPSVATSPSPSTAAAHLPLPAAARLPLSWLLVFLTPSHLRLSPSRSKVSFIVTT
uniref:Uncharacterized protein n=1 Tax=Oryza sativa subsp. japonica TaxID=39947 RepID=Q656C0_ORYSJ|nr:hypothetical protein [Oryza sativa Japonica Group]